MKTKMLFIYNANAGKGKIKAYLSDVMEKFCRADYDVTIYATGASGEARDLVLERGEEFEVIVCSGGDGTINEVLGGVTRLTRKPKVGYLPTGTVNDFASSLQIPKDPMEATDLILKGHTYSCDVGKFQNQHFNYIAGFGAFTEVAYETSQDLKNALGKTAYFVDAIGRLSDLRGYEMHIECDDGRVVDGNYIFGMIANTKSVGGFPLEGPNTRGMDLDDGLFEMVMVTNPQTPIELERVLVALMNRDTNSPSLDTKRVRAVKITCDEEVRWTLDGEDGGYHKEVDIQCLHLAVDIFSPVLNRSEIDEIRAIEKANERAAMEAARETIAQGKAPEEL